MKILIIISNYLPGTKMGGPVTSVRGIVDSIGKKFDFELLCSDRDYDSDVPYENIKAGIWLRQAGINILYLPPKIAGLKILYDALTDMNDRTVYLNSVFAFKFSILPLLILRLKKKNINRIIIAPRGEFSEGALKFGRVKKQLFLSIANFTGIYDELLWHASSEYEKTDILREIGKNANVHVALNIGRTASLDMSQPSCTPLERENSLSKLKIIFLSRIVPKKNLTYAIEVLSGLTDVEIEFTIAGPVEDQKYWEICLECIQELNQNVQCKIVGTVDASDVKGLLSQNHLFFLPTFGENFGHVVAESLSVGTPVLLADTTPWKDLKSMGLGNEFPLNEIEKFRRCIKQYYYELIERGMPLDRGKIMEQYGLLYDAQNSINEHIAMFEYFDK